MYKIDFDKYLKILNWEVLYWGIAKDFIEAKSAIDYANKLIENNLAEDESATVELLILESDEKHEILRVLCKLKADDIQEEKSIKCLRYMILNDIKNRKAETSEILSDIEGVYADFGYPEDMNSFIGYMPVEDADYNPLKHTQKENEERLIDNFNIFLEKEKERVFA